VSEPEYSAFQSHNFQQQSPIFNKYSYAVEKIFDRIEDLAILYSVVADEESRQNIRLRYERLMQREFIEAFHDLNERLRQTADPIRQSSLRARLAKISRNIVAGKHRWEKHSPT